MPEPLRILVVCTANICRSPAAARLLSRSLADLPVEVSSAGTAAEPGRPECERSSSLIGAAPDAEPTHSARAVTPELVRDADLVLALDRSHRSALAVLAPAARPRTFTLRQSARISDEVRGSLANEHLPDGAPPLPADPTDRLRWLVAELDAARGTASTQSVSDADTAGTGNEWHSDDVPDPHVLGYELHGTAIELVTDSVDRVAAVMKQVLAVRPDEWTPAGV